MGWVERNTKIKHILLTELCIFKELEHPKILVKPNNISANLRFSKPSITAYG